jgi:CheY-like chemotaxis protein
MAAARVLVIDDSPTIVRVVQLVLTKAGFAVEAAADGEAGLAAARAHRPDLILLDFVMPKMNGYQVCRELAADAGLRDVPVVLMSAKGDQVGERFVKVMGIVDYITKPFSPEAITAVVQHTVAKYQGADAPRTDAITAADLADGGAERGQALAALRDLLTEWWRPGWRRCSRWPTRPATPAAIATPGCRPTPPRSPTPCARRSTTTRWPGWWRASIRRCSTARACAATCG